MHKKLSFVIALFVFISSSAQLRSPDDFLGYEVGTRYTPHLKAAVGVQSSEPLFYSSYHQQHKV